MRRKEWRTFVCERCRIEFTKWVFTHTLSKFCSPGCRKEYLSEAARLRVGTERRYDSPVLPERLNEWGSRLLAAAVIRQALIDRDWGFLSSSLGEFYCDLADFSSHWVVHNLGSRPLADVVQSVKLR